MDIVNIYGHIANKSELIIGVGNYNKIHGLLGYFPSEDLLEIRSLSEIIDPSVIEVILTYEHPSKDKVYFSLGIKDTANYINIDQNGTACVSQTKVSFWIDYSSIDRKPRPQLLSGSLYSLKAIHEEKEHVVSWKIEGFSNGDLIIFLPTTWYERNDKSCELKNSVFELIENLNHLSFKGYSTIQWCEQASHVIHCHNDHCGKCLGFCDDINTICYVKGNEFICGNNEPRMSESNTLTLQETPPETTGTTATIIAIVIFVTIVSVLAWLLLIRNK